MQLSIHMKQVDGLCSPAAKTGNFYQNIQVEKHSSHIVTFSVVPMIFGSIPIIIQLYDRENELGVDAIEKTLQVKVMCTKALPPWEVLSVTVTVNFTLLFCLQTEGLLSKEEETIFLNLDGELTVSIFWHPLLRQTDISLHYKQYIEINRGFKSGFLGSTAKTNDHDTTLPFQESLT